MSEFTYLAKPCWLTTLSGREIAPLTAASCTNQEKTLTAQWWLASLRERLEAKRDELGKISDALARMDSGDYGLCTECGSPIAIKRIEAYPYADECIDCAELDEEIRART